MRYAVIIRRTSTGFSVDVPDIPGCVATAGSLEHARDEIASALETHFELMTSSGETIPPPSHRIEFTFDDDSGEEFCTWIEVESPVIARS
jgi:predicted RNase H-like HicB family nuclease